MIGNHFSLILLPTNKCNVVCEYCFEDKTSDFFVKDPYCQVYRAIFSTMEEIASKTASDRRRRSLPVLRTRA